MERNDLSHLPSALITRLSVAAAEKAKEDEEAFFIDTSRCAKRRTADDDR